MAVVTLGLGIAASTTVFSCEGAGNSARPALRWRPPARAGFAPRVQFAAAAFPLNVLSNFTPSLLPSPVQASQPVRAW